MGHSLAVTNARAPNEANSTAPDDGRFRACEIGAGRVKGPHLSESHAGPGQGWTGFEPAVGALSSPTLVRVDVVSGFHARCGETSTFGDDRIMTRGVLEFPPVPGMAPAGQTRTATRATLAVRVAFSTAALAAVLALVPASPAWAAKGDTLPEGTIAEVRVEGNSTISLEQVRAAILSRPGSPLD